MGNGFQMSNSRNSTKAPTHAGQAKLAAPASAIHWPTTSSTTQEPGSVFPQQRSSQSEAQTPRAVNGIASRAKCHGAKPANRTSANAMPSAASAPTVPGATGASPHPNHSPIHRPTLVSGLVVLGLAAPLFLVGVGGS